MLKKEEVEEIEGQRSSSSHPVSSRLKSLCDTTMYEYQRSQTGYSGRKVRFGIFSYLQWR